MKTMSLNVKNDLPKSNRLAVINAVNPLIADLFVLYVKIKNFHWHVMSSHFRDYHLLLDEAASALFEMIDPLAERVRKLGGMTIRSIEHIASLTTLKEEKRTSLTALQMMARLVADYQALLVTFRAAHAVCDEASDIATASLIEEYVDEAEKRLWFFCATQST